MYPKSTDVEGKAASLINRRPVVRHYFNRRSNMAVSGLLLPK